MKDSEKKNVQTPEETARALEQLAARLEGIDKAGGGIR